MRAATKEGCSIHATEDGIPREIRKDPEGDPPEGKAVPGPLFDIRMEEIM
jgi:hypothetical protein